MVFQRIGSSGSALGPRRFSGSSIALSAGSADVSPTRACHPVQLHTGGITQECESIDRRMDHHLTGLVEKLVGEHIAVAQGAKVIEPALVSLGCGSGGLALS